jgi:glyoxylase-like metal-dependent hydrolase (beta-lactamase superfamily II)
MILNCFLDASNQYWRFWNAKIWLHEQDAKHRLVTLFDIDQRVDGDFSHRGIEAYHIGGHTPGFTVYIYQDVLFICDFLFLTASSMQFNPYGPDSETRKQAQRIYQFVATKSLKTVCGYNYIANFID